jgi:hypothetical protein
MNKTCLLKIISTIYILSAWQAPIWFAHLTHAQRRAALFA